MVNCTTSEYFLKTQDLNIFFVDWASLAAGPCYPAAVWNTKHVGECTAQLVERIREFGNEDIHLVGFSLGGQLTNFVANTLRPYQVPRITGLDPAGPGFLTVSPENKLDKGDAQFVDVLHTNAFIQGTVEESGHVDFYLNGGVIQPGCWAENSESRFKYRFIFRHYAFQDSSLATTTERLFTSPNPSRRNWVFGAGLVRRMATIYSDGVHQKSPRLSWANPLMQRRAGSI